MTDTRYPTDDIPATERYIVSGAKRLRCGFTTGTAAALAAQAATLALLSGQFPERVTLRTPKGWLVHAEPVASETTAFPPARPGKRSFRCGIKKDAGDDPDVTDGCMVYAAVTLEPKAAAAPDDAEACAVSIDGGAGVGRVTKAGLDQKPGNAAINSVPRAQIADAVRTACAQWCFSGSAEVVIDVPGGEELAARTFNPHLGIVGGISILGTSGVVEPMSEAALIETIDAEIRIRASELGGAPGNAPKALVITPGNYGTDFIDGRTASDGALSALASLPRVRCSNFVGEAIDRAVLHGFTHLLLVGHAGKFVKLAGGIMNTHSRTADCRMELLAAHAALAGAPAGTLERVMQCVTVDAALDELDRSAAEDGGAYTAQAVMARIISAAAAHVARRAGGSVQTGVVMFTNVRGLLGKSYEIAGANTTWYSLLHG